MSFKITVTELTAQGAPLPDAEVKIYEQTVPELDLRAVVNAVMQRKRGPRAAAKKEAK